jgi:2-polyprenyl-6-methoxyphenol hydroxylase-like FAD-dependent oxidoreductase
MTHQNENEYDAIVVGARCAGSPTAMLLARQGHRVLVVDRATFPSDTDSTHFIHAKGVASLRRWGVLDQVVASGCPPVDHYSMDFGPITIAGTPRPADDGGVLAYCPRRTVLDKILVDAAVAAGAEVREGFTVEEVVVEDGAVVGIRGHGADGTAVEARAKVVIGADGRNSRVAKAVDPPRYDEKPVLQWSYYTYFRDLPVRGMEVYVRPDRGWAAMPTNDGLTLVVVGWPIEEAAAYKADVEANFTKTFELCPDFAARIALATRVEPFRGAACDNFFRRPYGPGWALVGDAGYTKDPITAQGITDAFRDAELCAGAIGDWLGGRSSFDDAMSGYQATRDAAVGPVYEFTAQLASLTPPPPELQQLLGAAAGDPEAMSDFVSLTTGTVSPVEFFDPANIGRIMAGAAA